MTTPDVLVVGGGVSGLTTAVCLAEAGARVEVRTAETPRETTSAVAGAVWLPYLAEPRDLVDGWGRRSLAELRELAADPATGVRLVTGTVAVTGRDHADRPDWADAVEAVDCPPERLPTGYVAGWRFVAPLVEMPVYLDYLVARLRSAGGTLVHRPVAGLAEAAREVGPGGMVVNCTGVAARDLVPDPAVRPVRGQVVVVENPGIEEFFTGEPHEAAEELVYVLPHRDTVVLGGTAEPDVDDRTPRPEVAERIIDRCTRIVPALAGARVVAHRVGLRPVRDRVRVSAEPGPDGTRVVHNYGHGGAGVTLSWGCARQAVELALGGADR